MTERSQKTNWIEVRLRVVAQEFGVSKQESCFQVVPTVPCGKWNRACRKQRRFPPKPYRFGPWARIPSTRSIAARASGMAIAVSLHKAAAANHNAAARGFRSCEEGHTPTPTACRMPQRCQHAPACFEQTRLDRSRSAQRSRTRRSHFQPDAWQAAIQPAAPWPPPSVRLRASPRDKSLKPSTRWRGKCSEEADGRWSAW